MSARAQLYDMGGEHHNYVRAEWVSRARLRGSLYLNPAEGLNYH